MKAKNRERITAACEAGRLRLELGSQVRQIAADEVLLELADGEPRLPNDAVIVYAGGILPSTFLESAGIAVETRFGTASRPPCPESHCCYCCCCSDKLCRCRAQTELAQLSAADPNRPAASAVGDIAQQWQLSALGCDLDVAVFLRDENCATSAGRERCASLPPRAVRDREWGWRYSGYLTEQGRDPIQLALLGSHEDTALQLIEHVTDLDKQTGAGQSYLMLALELGESALALAEQRHPELVGLIKEKTGFHLPGF